jgi:hypothetical protein
MDNAFSSVFEALYAEHVREHGERPNDMADWREMCAIEAGYLIGVRIGARLAGGAR